MKIKKIITIYIFVVFLFSFLNVQEVIAISKFEQFILEHSKTASLLILLLALVIIAAVIGLVRIRKFLKDVKERRKKLKIEIIKALKQVKLRHIPTGSVKDVSLPEAKIVYKNTIHLLSISRELRIGRSKSNDVVITDSLASKSHAKIRPEEEGYVLYDMISSNGTMVNGEKIERHVLQEGDNIIIGEKVLLFSKLHIAEAEEKEQTKSGKERRKFSRFDISCVLTYFVHSSKQQIGKDNCSVENMSVGGICMCLNKELPDNAIVEFLIELPDGRFVEGIGQLVWKRKLSDNKYKAGLKFTHLAKADLEKIMIYEKRTRN